MIKYHQMHDLKQNLVLQNSKDSLFKCKLIPLSDQGLTPVTPMLSNLCCPWLCHWTIVDYNVNGTTGVGQMNLIGCKWEQTVDTIDRYP